MAVKGLKLRFGNYSEGFDSKSFHLSIRLRGVRHRVSGPHNLCHCVGQSVTHSSFV